MIDLTNKQRGIVKSVQVKYTTCKTKYGNYQVALKSCGATKRTTYKTLVDTNVDYLLVATECLDMFLIPVEEISNKTTLNICDKYEKYRLNKNDFE